jgi:hypothetical protein
LRHIAMFAVALLFCHDAFSNEPDESAAASCSA